VELVPQPARILLADVQAAAWQDHGLVFCLEDGTPLYPNWVTARFERLATEAGLPG
jgi:hypothetical protein